MGTGSIYLNWDSLEIVADELLKKITGEEALTGNIVQRRMII